MPVEQFVPKEFPKDLPYNQQLIPVPGSHKPGATRAFPNSGYTHRKTHTPFSHCIPGIYRNAIFPDLVRPQPGESALTLHELFLSGMAVGADRPCLGWRPQISTNPVKFANKYEWLSYAQVNERRLNLGSAIEALFRSGRAGGGELPTVGVWCQNRPGASRLLLTHTHDHIHAPPFLINNERISDAMAPVEIGPPLTMYQRTRVCLYQDLMHSQCHDSKSVPRFRGLPGLPLTVCVCGKPYISPPDGATIE